MAVNLITLNEFMVKENSSRRNDNSMLINTTHNIVRRKGCQY